MYHLLCCWACPYEDACRCISRRMGVYECMRVWVRDCIYLLECSSVLLDLFIFSSYIYLPKGWIPEGLWQFYLSNVCLHFLLCMCVCLSLLLIWSLSHWKLLWLVLLLGLQWNRLEVILSKRTKIMIKKRKLRITFWSCFGHYINMKMSHHKQRVCICITVKMLQIYPKFLVIHRFPALQVTSTNKYNSQSRAHIL